MLILRIKIRIVFFLCVASNIFFVQLFIQHYIKTCYVYLDYPAVRGPLCFSCSQELDPTLCRTVRVCGEDEVKSLFKIFIMNHMFMILDIYIIKEKYLHFVKGMPYTRNEGIW